MPAIRSAISIVQVPELNTRTGRPPQCSESFASSAFTFGPEVIQPERRTSPTPAIVSSSIVGRVSGRYGRADCAGGVGLAAADTDMSGLVAEEVIVPALAEQMITKGRIGEKFLHILFPRHDEDAPRLRPHPPERRLVDKPVAMRLGPDAEHQLALILHRPNRPLVVIDKIVEELAVVIDPVPRLRLRPHDRRERLRAVARQVVDVAKRQ